MIVLDAHVLIAYLDGADAHHQAATQLLAREVDDDFAASSVTLAEVLVGPVGEGRANDAVAALQDLEVAEQLLPEGSARRLAGLRATTRLPMPDCWVLLAASDGLARVASFDKRLVRAARRLGLSTVGT